MRLEQPENQQERQEKQMNMVGACSEWREQDRQELLAEERWKCRAIPQASAMVPQCERMAMERREQPPSQEVVANWPKGEGQDQQMV